MSGTRKLTADKAHVVAKNLGLDNQESKHFLKLVHLEAIKNDQGQKEQIEKIFPSDRLGEDRTQVNNATFKVVSEWPHIALLMLTQLSSFKPDLSWISKRLRISPVKTSVVIERLLKLKLLQKAGDGELGLAGKSFFVKDAPSASVRSFHRSMLQKSIEDLESPDPKKRNVTGITLALDKSKIAEVNTMIDNFKTELSRYSAGLGTKTGVYNLTLSLTRLDEGDE